VRVVLDTNVLVSGIFFGGVPAEILRAWSNERFELLVSPRILDEYRRICRELGDSYPKAAATYPSILERIAGAALIVPDERLEAPVCDNPYDDVFLAVAGAGRASINVSGDRGC
jgi:putative PIN family toxin of toxin-antitoxin system